MSELNIVICIDDAHPEPGWGMPDDECTSYLHKLNSEFGCKFVQFVPSNYHGEYRLSNHVDWVKYWSDIEWIELAAHGHYHDCRAGGPGECEMAEHTYTSAQGRLANCIMEWQACGFTPKGWRMPGWLATQGSFDAVSKVFDYVAIHESHNNSISISDNVKVFKGADSINAEPSSLSIWNGNTIMFQSHINGPTNTNNWTLENYESFRNTLRLLEYNYNLQYKTLEELL